MPTSRGSATSTGSSATVGQQEFRFGDGRNQESSSEAVNAWYGVELLGRALGNETLGHVGSMVRAVEIASAQTYWQVTEASKIYPAPFKAQHVVGVLWSTKVDFTTFFGDNREYIYGIQMLPSLRLQRTCYSRRGSNDAWPQLSAAAQGAKEQGWKGFMHMAHAVVAKEAAMADIQKLTSYDDAE